MSQLHIEICKTIEGYAGTRSPSGKEMMSERFYSNMAKHIEKQQKAGMSTQAAIQEYFEGAPKLHALDIMEGRRQYALAQSCTAEHPHWAMGVIQQPCIWWHIVQNRLQHDQFYWPKEGVEHDQYCREHICRVKGPFGCEMGDCDNSALVSDNYCRACYAKHGEKIKAERAASSERFEREYARMHPEKYAKGGNNGKSE